MRAIFFVLIPLAAAACKPQIPEGVFSCSKKDDCPSPMVCRSDGFCWGSFIDTGIIADARVRRDATVRPDAREDAGDAEDAPDEDVPGHDAEEEDAPAMDALPPDSADAAEQPDRGVVILDADVDAGCMPSACDDNVDCTIDSCTADGRCVSLPDDTRCIGSPTGPHCDRTLGCIEEPCSVPTCVAGPCEAVSCMGTICMRTSLCNATTEECCANRCVPMGCSDGEPCTDDFCTAMGCMSVADDNNSCDDGLFCDGVEACSGGMCFHTGDPCAPMAGTTCNEATRMCL